MKTLEEIKVMTENRKGWKNGLTKTHEVNPNPTERANERGEIMKVLLGPLLPSPPFSFCRS